MSIVVITGSGPEHRFVANRIVAAHEVAAILVCDPAPRRRWSAVLRKSPVRFADKALRQVYLRAIGDAAAREATLRRILGRDSEAFSRPDLVRPVGRPKDGLLARTVAGLRPRIVAVYGTGVVPDDVLALADQIALNMHTGLSPWYRGTACAFWPVVAGDFERIGATVHECTSQLDGGRIFFRERTPLFRGDDLHAIFARTVRTGTDGYVDVLARALEGTLAGEVQDLGLGREYRGDALGLRPELAARRALRRAAPHWPKHPPAGG